VRRRQAIGGAAFVVVLTACSSAFVSVDPGPSQADLRATARAWAHAYLVGSVADIRALQGPACTVPPPTTKAGVAAAGLQLQRMRAELQARLGRRLDRIKIRRVVTRSVSSGGSATGQASVRYDLPPSVAGTDNWVTYAAYNGRWMVEDCIPPIGGNSASGSSSSSATPTP
jgi:hypothetical protein